MAGKKSIGDLHSNVTANAQQFVSEFTRADNVARQRTAAIDKELDKLGKSIQRKFSGADIGKSILQGLGIGSGFAAADLVVGKFVDLWREADEKAKEAQVSIEKLNATFSELHRLTRESAIENLLPAEQIAARKEQLAAVRQQLDQLATKTAKYAADMGKLHKAGRGFISGTAFDPFQGEYGYGKNAKTLGDEISAAQEKIGAEIAEKFTLLNSLTKQLKGAEAETTKGDEKAKQSADQRVAALQRVLEAKHKTEQEGLDFQAEALTENLKILQSLDAMAAKYKDIADPQREFGRMIDEIVSISDRLTMEEYAKAIEHVNQAMQDAEDKRVDSALNDFFGSMDEESKKRIEGLNKIPDAAKHVEQELNAMWNSVSDRAGQAFADMVLSGEAAFGDLVNIVARSVIEMAARMAIINPLLNGIFGGMASYGMMPAFYGAGAASAGTASAGYAGLFASGGTLDPGQWGVAGENGPEPIFAGSAPLTVIPNGGAGGGKGDTFHFEYNIGAGVTREQLLPILKMQQRDTISKISDMRRRGSGGMAFA